LAVGREADVADATVKAAGQDFSFATRGWGEAQVLGGVLHQLGFGLRDVGDPFPIGRPCSVVIFAGIGGDLREVRALVGVVRGDGPDVVVVVAIRVGGAVAGESQLLAIGRPRRLVIVVITAGDLRQAFCRQIEDIQVVAAVI